MDTRLRIVEVLVVDERAFDRSLVCLEAVRLRVERVRITVPRHVIAEKETGHAHAPELFVVGVRVLDQVLALDSVPAHEIGDPEAQEPAELLEPAPGEDVVLGGAGGPAVLVLRVLTPHDQRDLEPHRDPDRNREDRDVLRP